MKAAELKGKSAEELKGLVADWKKEQFNLRFRAAAGEQITATRWREIRKGIARAKTFMNQQKKEGK